MASSSQSILIPMRPSMPKENQQILMGNNSSLLPPKYSSCQNSNTSYQNSNKNFQVVIRVRPLLPREIQEMRCSLSIVK